MVFFQRFIQRAQYLSLVLWIYHVNEVQNNNTAQVTDTKLTRDSRCRLKVGFQHRFSVIFTAQVSTGIHINGGHRFGLIDNQVPA